MWRVRAWWGNFYHNYICWTCRMTRRYTATGQISFNPYPNTKEQ